MNTTDDKQRTHEIQTEVYSDTLKSIINTSNGLNKQIPPEIHNFSKKYVDHLLTTILVKMKSSTNY